MCLFDFEELHSFVTVTLLISSSQVKHTEAPSRTPAQEILAQVPFEPSPFT